MIDRPTAPTSPGEVRIPTGISPILHGRDDPTTQTLIRRRRGGWNSKKPPSEPE